MLQAVDREIQREYLSTMIIAKAVVLNREDSTEIDEYNKLMKQYHDLIFLGMTESTINKKSAQSYDALMKSFRQHFSKKVVHAEKSKTKIKDDLSNVSMKNLGDMLTDRDKKKRK